MSRQIRVIVNPASGKPQPVLHILNQVFRPTGVHWELCLTHDSGDAARFAREAANAGFDVVAAYGGDGTVMEVAQGLAGTDTPMAILPGGTANLMSVELGIPKDLTKACVVAVDPKSVVRQVDMGRIGDRHFLLRVGIGFAAEKVRAADRRMKDRFGVLAYSIGALKATAATRMVDFRITIDGKSEDVLGLTSVIDNAGTMGFHGLSHGQQVSVSDGLLDVFVVASAAGQRGWQAFASNTSLQYRHWAGREIEIECEPAQYVQGDGEMWGQTPISAYVIPSAVNVLTPAP